MHDRAFNGSGGETTSWEHNIAESAKSFYNEFNHALTPGSTYCSEKSRFVLLQADKSQKSLLAPDIQSCMTSCKTIRTAYNLKDSFSLADMSPIPSARYRPGNELYSFSVQRLAQHSS